MNTAKWSGVAGLSMLVACGGEGTKQDAASGSDESSDVAGGETSEFSSGDQPGCPEIVAEIPLDLGEADIAAWVALSQGHHEIGLHWTSEFDTDTLSGFEEHTQLSLDVTALRARELVYGTGGYDNPEIIAACDGTKARQLQLDISVQTSDGALEASFQHWVAGAATGVHSAEVHERNSDYDADSFISGITLGVDAALGGSERLGVYLLFDAESVRGTLTPYVSLPPSGSRDYDASWAPVSGRFPDDGCGPYNRVVDLDEQRSELATTPRAAFESSLLRRGTAMAAVWEAPSSSSSPERVLGQTQVSVSAGAPTHACQDSDRIEIYAPISVETADGSLSMTQPGSISSRLNGGEYVRSHSRWIPANAFESATGMSLDAGESEYVAVELNYWQTSDGSIEGNLSVHLWQDFEAESFARPGLHW